MRHTGEIKKLPLLVQIHKEFHETSIHSSSLLDVYSLNTWLSNIDLSETILYKIDEMNLPKRYNRTSNLRELCDRYMRNNFSDSYQLYTDASKESYCSGASIYDPQTSTTVKLKIDANVSIMYSELIAISDALSYSMSVNSDHVVIFSDSKSALLHLARLPSRYRGSPIAFVILNTIREIRRTNKTVIIQWIPFHTGIAGNERADEAAKLACSEGETYTCMPLYTDLIHTAREKCQDMWQEYFNERSLTKGIWYKTIQSETLRHPWFQEMIAHRQYVVTMLRLRSGHVPSNKFTHLMGKSNSPNCPDCNSVDDIQHILCECVRNESQRRQLMSGVDRSVGRCNSILSAPFSDEARSLCAIYLARMIP